MDRQHHPVASIFPMMSDDAARELREDIAKHGLREPIWLHPDGSIIDGRNRYAACLAAGVEPVFRTWDGEGSLVEFVVSLNLHRRHLSSSQKAAIAVKLLPMLEAEARERQGHRTDLTSVNDLTEVAVHRATDQAAALTGTNRQYVSDAKKLAAERPDLMDRVASGELTIPKAKAAASVIVNRVTGEAMDEADLERVTRKPLVSPKVAPGILVPLSRDAKKAAASIADRFDKSYIAELVSELGFYL